MCFGDGGKTFLNTEIAQKNGCHGKGEKEINNVKKERQKGKRHRNTLKELKNNSLQLYTNPKSDDRLVYGTIHPFDSGWIFLDTNTAKNHGCQKRRI